MSHVADAFVVQLMQAEAPLRALVRRLVAADDVDDVVQTTWVAAWRRGQAGAGLLAAIARRSAAFLHRGRARQRQRERRAARGETVQAADVPVQRMETIAVVAAAVCALPEPYRRSVILHYHEGKSVDAIAATVGVSPLVVRKRLQRGRELLRARLAIEFGHGWRSSPALLLLLPARRSRVWVPVAVAAMTAVVALPAAFGGAVVPLVEALPIADGGPSTAGGPAVDEVHRREAVVPVIAPPASAAYVRQDPGPVVTWQLTITVVDPNGRPVDGAIVRHEQQDRWTKNGGRLQLRLSDAPVPLADRIMVRESDPRQAKWQPVVRDGLRAYLRAAAKHGGDVALELQFTAAALSIAGKVVRADGTPAVGVTVFLGESDAMDPESWPRAPLQPVEDLAGSMEGEVVMGDGRVVTGLHVPTAVDGTFELRGLRARDYVLHAASWRERLLGISATTPAGSTGIVIQLPAPGQRTVRGAVRDPSGRPLADVAIVALLPLLRVGGVTGHEVVAQVHSAVDGSFEFAVPMQAAALAVRTPALLPVEAPIAPGESPTVLITDTRCALRIAGQAVPFPGGSVRILDVRERPLWLCADADSLLPPQLRWPCVGGGEVAFATSRDAAMAVFADAEGVERLRRPCLPQPDGSLLVR